MFQSDVWTMSKTEANCIIFMQNKPNGQSNRWRSRQFHISSILATNKNHKSTRFFFFLWEPIGLEWQLISEKSFNSISGFVAEGLTVSLDFSVHQTADEHRCDGGQSSSALWGQTERKMQTWHPPPHPPFYRFLLCTEQTMQGALSVLWFRGKEGGGDFLFFFFGAVGFRIISHPAGGEDSTVEACPPKDSSM